MKPILAVFKDPKVAHRAVEQLVHHGISPEDISLLSAESNHGHHQFDLHVSHKGSESIAWGMVAGTVVGAAVGGFAAAAAGPLGLLGAMPIATTFIGATTGTAVGGAAGGAVGLGKPKIEAELMNGGHRHHDVNTALIGIRVDSEEQVRETQSILERLGGDVRS